MKMRKFPFRFVAVLVATMIVLIPRAQEQDLITRLDTSAYSKKLNSLANSDKTGRWPVSTQYPLAGAVLPFNRIVAYYGNLYSTHMGILGEIPKDQMIKKLKGECETWEKADPSTPVIPALHYIAVTAQASPGHDGKYRARMPAQEIEKIIEWAREINGLAFVDIQPGFSTLKDEVPLLEKFLSDKDVHLGIDAEFSMKQGKKPGTVIGSLDAADINYTIEFLAELVRKHKLTPKVLVIHRFTEGMITNYKQIKPVPEVQVVMSMDGFGSKTLKRDTYNAYIYKEPVQFAGFKLFYKNDKPVMYMPAELVKLTPQPVYIQYQ